MKKPVIDPYRQVLDLFVETDINRVNMLHPFIQQEFALATDAHTVVWFPSSLLADIDFESHPKAPNALKVIPPDQDMQLTIPVKALKQNIARATALAAGVYVKDIQTCPDCDGSGYVDYVFRDYKRQEHELESECPACDGDGAIVASKHKETGDLVTEDYNVCLQVGGANLRVEYCERLLKTADLLNEAFIKMVWYGTEVSVKKFMIGQCGVLVMPVGQGSQTDYDLVYPLEY